MQDNCVGVQRVFAGRFTILPKDAIVYDFLQSKDPYVTAI